MFTDEVSLLWPNDMEKLEVSLDLETWPLNQCLESEHVTIATKLEHGGKCRKIKERKSYHVFTHR